MKIKYPADRPMLENHFRYYRMFINDVIQPTGGLVICVTRVAKDRYQAGIAICSPADIYLDKEGRKKSYGRSISSRPLWVGDVLDWDQVEAVVRAKLRNTMWKKGQAALVQYLGGKPTPRCRVDICQVHTERYSLMFTAAFSIGWTDWDVC